MFFLELTETFSAAHALRNYPGVCSRTHGHNFTARIHLSAPSTDADGLTADYALLREKVMGVLQELDHQNLNDHPHFQEVNPTSENIARYLFDRLANVFPESVSLDDVQVAETSGFSVTYKP